MLKIPPQKLCQKKIPSPDTDPGPKTKVPGWDYQFHLSN